jgi:prefoldin beta subunit
MDKETENQIKELQMLEQNLQSVMMQKQAFQMEMTEIENSLEELGKSSEEVYKIVGNIMMKATKAGLLKELEEKKDLVALRLKTISGQEKTLEESSEKLRNEVLSKMKQ